MKVVSGFNFSDEFMSLKEGAAMVGVTLSTFYSRRFRQSKGIKVYRFGNGKQGFVNKKELLSLLRGN